VKSGDVCVNHLDNNNEMIDDGAQRMCESKEVWVRSENPHDRETRPMKGECETMIDEAT
jgi:hypothetical protein